VTIKQVLSRAREILAADSIEDSPLESELLLRHVLKIDRTELYQDFNGKLSPEQEKGFWSLIERRLNREPTAYIMSHREFYGLDFYVDPSVLIPRPESELLVEKALELARQRAVATIADIGTGCGALAISLALSLPQTRVYATDVSNAALKVTLANCQRHGATDRIHLLAGNLLDPLPEPVDLIVANLPYVSREKLPKVNTRPFEPSLALDGGQDGLDTIRQLCTQVSDKLHPGGSLLLEIGQGQSKAVIDFLSRLFPSATIKVTPDLSSVDRVVSLYLAPAPHN